MEKCICSYCKKEKLCRKNYITFFERPKYQIVYICAKCEKNIRRQDER